MNFGELVDIRDRDEESMQIEIARKIKFGCDIGN